MKLLVRNTLVVVLASATLLGGLLRPPYVEPTEAAKVPGIEILRASDPGAGHNVQQSAVQRLSAPTEDTLERNGQLYVPIRSYVEAHDGRLIYNPETTTVDITVDSVSFSLLLAEDAIMSDGRLTEGGFIVQGGAAYLSINALSELTASHAEPLQFRA
jgi:hypothetical protein